MKRIALFFAAIAALSSCMKENSLAPAQPADGQVTIKAVAADTKTLLDGTAVVWENNDAVQVVFNGEKTYTSVFTTTLSENATFATFVGALSPEVTVAACGENGYAVYPSTVKVESDGRIKFAVADTQNGKFETGENLSYATVSLTDIRETHSTTASFANALSLLKVTVPAGVKSVTVESCGTEPAPLTGKAPFYYTDGKLEIDAEEWSDWTTEMVDDPESTDNNPKPAITVQLRNSAVVLANADNSDLAAGDHWLHVFPGTHGDLKITVTGTDCSYEKTIGQEYEFVASKYHSLNVCTIFSLGTETLSASPFGGTVEIPVTTTLEDYDVAVTYPDGVAEWLTYAPTKAALRKDVLALTAAANTTSSPRTATVTLTSGSETLAAVTVSQKNYVAELLGEYLETYSANGVVMKGHLTVEPTDNATEGDYKITMCGMTAYADFADNTLLVYDGTNSYQFSVTADFSSITGPSYFQLADTFVTDYKAILPLGEPELTAAEAALVGTYNEAWTHNGADVITEKGMLISASEEAAYGQLKVKFLTVNGSSFEGYASLSGNTLTVNVGKQQHRTFNQYMAKDVVIPLTVGGDGSLSFANWTDAHGITVTNYTATKAVAEGGDTFTVNDLLGTWTQEFSAGGSTWPKSDMTITLSDDASKGQMKITDMYSYNSSGSLYSLTCYANLESDGKTLTVLCNGVGFGVMDNFIENLQMTVSREGNAVVIKFTGSTQTKYGMPLGWLTATKK